MNHDELKSKVDQLRRKADKAAGVLQEQMKQLKKEFGCSSLEEAEKLLKKLKREREEKLNQFAKDYDHVLED